jgi:cell wall assembly regulator SMI1
VNPSWPGSGPWVIAATSADVDWRIAAAALAAAAEVPVAAVVVGAAPETVAATSAAPDDPVRPHLAGLLELPAAGRLTLGQARDLMRAMTRAYGLVLIAAPAGLLVPLGRDDWTLADLAAAVGAPAVVVTGPGPDAVNHTTLALGALAGHGIAASVVTIGEVDEAALPVTPAGRIPASPDGFAGAAEWLDPLLRATAAAPPAPAPAPDAGRPVADGKRVVLGLLAVFVVLVAVVCGLAWWGRDSTEVVQTGVSLYGEPAPQLSAEIDAEPWPSIETEPAPPDRRGVAADVCPQRAGRVAVTRPAAATTARVDKAWQRIEKWLAAHAPAGARALRPPASAARIDELQRRMSVAFPPDLVASLRRHDGVSGAAAFTLPPFFAPSPLAGILRDWQVNCEVLADEDMDWTDAWWDKAFVPFAAAGDGGSLVVDQRPGGHGRVGEFYAEDGTSFERWPASVAELLERTATSLETGRPYGGHYTPRVVGGVLDWDIK